MMCNICQCGHVDPCPVIHAEDECTYNDCEDCEYAMDEMDWEGE